MSSETMHPVQTLLRPGSLAQHITWRLERKAALGMLLILVTLSLIGWLYLTQASSLATISFQIEQHRAELSKLNQQNAQLELEIAKWESLPRIEQRARELGFGPRNQVLYLSVPNYPNQQISESANQQTPAPYHTWGVAQVPQVRVSESANQRAGKSATAIPWFADLLIR
jgi:cell division protein FtsL